MSKPLKEDYIIRIKSRIEQHVKEPVEQEEKEEFVELMTRGQFVQKGGSYYITYKETETTGYEGCTTTLKIAADGSRVAMLRFGKGGGAGTQLLIEKGKRNLCHYETGYGSMTLGVTADEIEGAIGHQLQDRVRPDREGRHRKVRLPAGCQQRRACEPQPP